MSFMMAPFNHKQKDIIKEAIDYLIKSDQFGHWDMLPIIAVENHPRDEEMWYIRVEHPDTRLEYNARLTHNAMDIAVAYVTGYLNAKGLQFEQDCMGCDADDDDDNEYIIPYE